MPTYNDLAALDAGTASMARQLDMSSFSDEELEAICNGDHCRGAAFEAAAIMESRARQLPFIVERDRQADAEYYAFHTQRQ